MHIHLITFLKKKIKPGTILSIFPNKNLLVKTVDGSILITEYSYDKKIIEGLVCK